MCSSTTINPKIHIHRETKTLTLTQTHTHTLHPSQCDSCNLIQSHHQTHTILKQCNLRPIYGNTKTATSPLVYTGSPPEHFTKLTQNTHKHTDTTFYKKCPGAMQTRSTQEVAKPPQVPTHRLTSLPFSPTQLQCASQTTIIASRTWYPQSHITKPDVLSLEAYSLLHSRKHRCDEVT